MWTKLLGLGLIASYFSGCSYVASVSQTNLPKNRSQVVTAEVKKYIILGFNFDNEEFTKIPERLQEKCPGGRVEGVMTKDQVTLYALIFFWARHVEATGFCQKSTVALGGDLL